MRIPILHGTLRAAGAAVLLSALTVGSASAGFLVLPSTVPSHPVAGEINAACGGSVRAATLDMLGSIRTAYANAEKSSSSTPTHVDSATGLDLSAIYSGGQHYIGFKIVKKLAKIGMPDFLDCITVYAGSEQMVQKLGLYVPGDDVARGTFFYTPRIGIYADPRLIRPAGNAHD